MEMCVYLSNQLSLLVLNKVANFLSNNLPDDGEAVWLPFSVPYFLDCMLLRS